MNRFAPSPAQAALVPPSPTRGEGKEYADDLAEQVITTSSPRPFALVQGEPFTQLPEDLYIPPDALEIILESFEGPLDLLLYLIRRHNLDILHIPIAEITRQYIQYIELMQIMRLELAAEYLVMAATLAEIKSRMLLPRPPVFNDEEDDPRAELIRRLQEYERFKKAAEELDELPQQGRDVFSVKADIPDWPVDKPLPQVELSALLKVFCEVLRRAEMFAAHHIQREPLSIRERMSTILQRISNEGVIHFYHLFTMQEGRLGVVVSFIAILELLRQALIEIIQTEYFGVIHIEARVSNT